MELDNQSFLLGSALECPYVYYVPPLLRDSLDVVRDIAAEKGFNIALLMTLEHVVHISNSIEMDKKSNFQQRIINVTKRATSSRSLNIRGVFRTQSKCR